MARQALQLVREKGERGHEAHVLYVLGDIASCEAPVNTAATEANYCRASALAEELSMRPLVAHCHLGLGKFFQAHGRPAAGAGAPYDCHDDVPRDGDAVLAGAGGSRDEPAPVSGR